MSAGGDRRPGGVDPIQGLLLAAVLIAATALLYGRGLDGGPVADDHMFLRFAAFAERFTFSQSLSWFYISREEMGLAGDSVRLFRPLADLSFVWQWSEPLDGLQPYRLFNLGLHALSGLLLAGIAGRLAGGRAAWAAGLLFVLSPAHPESCLWLSSRVNLLANVGILAAILASLHRGRLALVLALAAHAVALGSKETGLVVAPLLTVLAWVEAPTGARLPSVLRRAGPHLALLALYLFARHHALGTLTGGYPSPDWGSGAYWYERLSLVGLLLAPVHELSGGAWARLLLGGVVCVVLLLMPRARPTETPGLALVAFWLLGLFGLLYNAPFEVHTLQDSRLLYEPTAALCLGLGLAVAGLAARPAGSAVAVLALLFGAFAWRNAEPWLRAGATASTFAAVAEEWRDQDFERRLIADVPRVDDGAYVFFSDPPSLETPFHPAEVVERVELFHTHEWERLRVALEAQLETRPAEEIDLWRWDPERGEVVRQRLSPNLSSELVSGLDLFRADRDRGRPGDPFTIQFSVGEESANSVDFSLIDSAGVLHGLFGAIWEGPPGLPYSDSISVQVPETAAPGPARIVTRADDIEIATFEVLPPDVEH